MVSSRRRSASKRTSFDELTTTERGYGWAHQQARTQAIRDMRDGQPCTRCGKPLYRSQAHALHLDHYDDRSGYAGLAHPRCNTRAGQAKAMRNRTVRVQQTPRSRNW